MALWFVVKERGNPMALVLPAVEIPFGAIAAAPSAATAVQNVWVINHVIDRLGMLTLVLERASLATTHVGVLFEALPHRSLPRLTERDDIGRRVALEGFERDISGVDDVALSSDLLGQAESVLVVFSFEPG